MTYLSRLSIKQRILAILVTAIAASGAIVAVNAIALRALIAIEAEGASLAADAIRTEELSGMGAKLYQVVADTEINADTDAAIRDWQAVKAESIEDIAAVTRMVDTPAERAKMADAQAALDRIINLYETRLVPTVKAAHGVTAEVRAIDDAIDREVDQLGVAADAVVGALERENEAGQKAFIALADRARFWSIVVAGLGMLLLAGVGWFVATGVSQVLQRMASELRSGAEQVSAASAEMASASQVLSQGATDQASSLEETSASIEEMSSMTRRNADHARQAAGRISETATLTKDADGELDGLVRSMSEIREASTRVTKIVRTIDEIAFQTNILALNAAVEAARAGESGMGFAVVADEVRSLAQRSAAAARDTAALVESSATSADAGAVKVEGVVTVMRKIADSATVVKGLIDEVSAASHEQAQGIDQVREAISRMEKVTQNTAATAEERAAASEELNAHAEQSVDVVSRLEALIGVSASVAGRGVAARPARPVHAAKPGLAPSAPTPVRQPLRVVPKAGPVPAPKGRTAEELLPLEDTGTFGSF